MSALENKADQYVAVCEMLYGQKESYYRGKVDRELVSFMDFSEYYLLITGLPCDVYRPYFGIDAFDYSGHFVEVENKILNFMEGKGIPCITTMLLYDHTKRLCMIFSEPKGIAPKEIADYASECFNKLYAQIFDMNKTPHCNYTVLSSKSHGYNQLRETFQKVSRLSRQKFFDMRPMVMTPALLKEEQIPADREQIHEDMMQLHIALKASDRAGISEHFGNIIRQLKAARDFELLEDTLRRLRSMLENTMNSHGKELSEQEGALFGTGRYPTIDHMAQAIETCLIFCAGQLRDCPAMSVPIREAVRYIRHHYAEDVSLDIVAQYVGMSPSWVSRRFSQECGCSIPQYLLDVRMERAKALLLETNKHVFEVAQAVGIENARYFVSLFRKSTGMTPTAFREQRDDPQGGREQSYNIEEQPE